MYHLSILDNCTPSSFYSSIYSNRIDEELDDPFEYKECPDHFSHMCINGRCYMDKDNITFCICQPQYEGPHCEYLTNDLKLTVTMIHIICP
uniref:EGF-like domain-containing protein n=1 Tax=Acrobeloides nanus TaxID=290746 RepID=A0A914ECX4_9BILA